jgi:hypothetical protein
MFRRLHEHRFPALAWHKEAQEELPNFVADQRLVFQVNQAPRQQIQNTGFSSVHCVQQLPLSCFLMAKF